jgi:hypothetical protein
VEPSIVTEPEIIGKAVEGVIVWSPEPGMLNTMVSAPKCALASRIACLSEPAPLSLALVTTNVDAGAVITTVSVLESASGTTGARMKTKTNGTDSNKTALLVVLLIGQCEGWKPIHYESIQGTGKALYGDEIVTFLPLGDFLFGSSPRLTVSIRFRERNRAFDSASRIMSSHLIPPP